MAAGSTLYVSRQLGNPSPGCVEDGNASLQSHGGRLTFAFILFVIACIIAYLVDCPRYSPISDQALKAADFGEGARDERLHLYLVCVAVEDDGEAEGAHRNQACRPLRKVRERDAFWWKCDTIAGSWKGGGAYRMAELASEAACGSQKLDPSEDRGFDVRPCCQD